MNVTSITTKNFVFGYLTIAEIVLSYNDVHTHPPVLFKKFVRNLDNIYLEKLLAVYLRNKFPTMAIPASAERSIEFGDNCVSLKYEWEAEHSL